MRAREEQKTDNSSFKLLLWTAIAGIVFGLIGFGEIAEDVLRAGRNSLHWHKASGDIVLVKIDEQSLRQVGRWPWPRRHHAELTDALTGAGAKRIFFDIAFFGESDPTDDRRLADALQRSGRVVLPAKTRFGPGDGTDQEAFPHPMFRSHTQLGTISLKYNYQNAVWRLPYSVTSGNQRIHSHAALLADRGLGDDGEFFLDYSLDPSSIPSVSASNILDGKFDRSLIAGKDVVIGATTNAIGDVYFIPGTGQMGGAYVQVIGAETLKAGRPTYLGWIPLFLLSLAVVALTVRRQAPRTQTLALSGLAIALLTTPAALEARLVFLDVTPGLFVAAVGGVALIRRRFKQRGLVNAVSGLPNLNALKAHSGGRDQALIVARILNYSEIAATLPADSERQLIEQIVGRLSIGTKDRVFYQGDGGIFAWFEETRKPFRHHIEALSALFRNPVRVSGMSIDLAITFGVEIGSGRSLGNRLGSALVAADEAAHDGLKWKYHDPDRLENASWKLSMLSQLDAAIDSGEVWIAYQPQLDLATRKIVGAEALARWTHPDKGPIAASEFVAAAEQHDRIGKLTDYVLDKAVGSAAAINRRGEPFDVAVNLSARLLNDSHFIMRVSAMLARHKLPPARLTLELTETAELIDNGHSLDMLGRLRDLGVRISIDDYGTGLSTLEYLKKIPANEIKIDQGFVKGLCDNRSDRLMVQSTIGLAHSLGRKVVAEGVEQRETLDALIEMGCDVAQGFIIGRPMSIESLAKRIAADRRRRVA